MKNLKNFYSSPYFLSLVPFIIIILLIQNGFKRYLLEIDSSILLPKNFSVWFDDLNNDGSSEKIMTFDQNTSTGITISNDSGIIDQWNLTGNFNFFLKECLFITGDKDNNGRKEVYAFTLSSDSIFMHCISDLKNPVPSIRNRLIAIAGPGLKTPDPFIIPAEMEDLDNDGIKELIFGISSGFSLYPRNVFAYFISKDSLVVSPESSYFIHVILQSDITGDGKREIIPYGYATSNVSPEEAKYHDCSSFLMILDQNLKFLFNPIEFIGKYSGLTPLIRETEHGNSLAMLYTPPAAQTSSTIYYANPDGHITDTIQLTFHATTCLNTTIRNNKNMFLMVKHNYGIELFNDNFEVIKDLPNKNINTIIQKDYDMDGTNEILIVDNKKSSIIIYREGLTHPAATTITPDENMSCLISIKNNLNSDPIISVQSGQNLFMMRYKKNPGYPYYYLFYLGIYLGVLGFALTIRNIQKNQLRKKYDNEKKISQLQLALIRNQLDPHFTLNVINSIIYSIDNSNRDQAGDQLRRFANLYRNLLLSATSIQRSIEDELNFCNDYLMFEKMRFGEKFNYKIFVSDDVNRNILVPKLLIQLHAENAVKHGLATLKSGGIINISLKNTGNALLIEVIDNGIGREKAGNQIKMTTGKGLELMSELYLIYNKYYNENISSEIVDLYHENGQPAGTKVIIRISKQNEKE